jgi:hypothetical protein
VTFGEAWECSCFERREPESGLRQAWSAAGAVPLINVDWAARVRGMIRVSLLCVFSKGRNQSPDLF